MYLNQFVTYLKGEVKGYYGRSLLLYKLKGDKGWSQGTQFWQGNHEERCDAAIAELQQLSKDIQDGIENYQD